MRHPLASLCCFCTAFTAASAIAAPLDVDAAYGSQGVATSTVAVEPVVVGVSILQPDGKLIVTATHAAIQTNVPDILSGDSRFHWISVRRFDADGSVDLRFGVNGAVSFTVRGSDIIKKIVLQADGKIVLAVDAGEPCSRDYFSFDYCSNSAGQLTVRSSAVVRLTPDGALDSSFNGTGVVNVTDFWGAYGLAVQQDGKLLLLGTKSYLRYFVFDWYLTRINADGSRDTTFNHGQSVEGRCESYGRALVVQGDGKIVIAGSTGFHPLTGFCIERLFPDGRPDPSFFVSTDVGFGTYLESALELPDGKLLAVGWKRTDVGATGEIVAARYGADGTLDATYGVGGLVHVSIGSPTASSSFRLLDAALTRDGGLVALGKQWDYTQGSGSNPVWVRLSAGGHLDTTLGVNGIALGAGRQGLAGFLRDFQERWLLVGAATMPFGAVNAEITRFAGDRTDRLNVVEFYHAGLDHYFITADPGEAAAIDAGSAGPGWARTGESFKGGGTHFVCRFYGSTSPGPNSHFYTVTPSECGSLKSLQKTTPATQRRWNFEDLDFATTPTSGGNCPASTIPVYRVYNNGFARGIDSNHRFSKNRAIIDQMVSRGWLYEGPQMCAPL